MASKKALLVFTRYYKGEDENPFVLGTIEHALWTYEYFWVRDTMRAEEGGEGSYAANQLQKTLLGYLNRGLKDFCSGDGVPIGLKAYIFHMHNRKDDAVDIDGFEKVYEKYYSRKR